MVGWEMTPDQLGNGRLPNRTAVENLYLTGHWTEPGGGVTPVIISAQRVAQLVLGNRNAIELPPFNDHLNKATGVGK